MFKIKLLILLLINLTLFSCTNNKTSNNSLKFSISYISGEYDGLILKNILTNHMKSIMILDTNSFYEIHPSISHKSSTYITNINNTSERERVFSSLSVTIIDKITECSLYSEKFSLSQFYIYAPGDKFISNQKAYKKIKKENTESLVKKLINKLNKLDLTCKSLKYSN